MSPHNDHARYNAMDGIVDIRVDFLPIRSHWFGNVEYGENATDIEK